MSELELLNGEDAVASRSLLYVYGRLLSATGTLHVTSKRIVFEPASRLDRSVGARRVSIPLRSVESIEYRGTVRTRLILTTSRAEHVFLDRQRDEVLLSATRAAIEAFRAQAPSLAVAPEAAEEHTGEVLPPHTGPVLLLGDTEFYGVPLRGIIENLDLEATCVDDADAATAAYDQNLRDLSLVIVNLHEHPAEAERTLAHIRDSGHAAEVPVWIIEPLFDKLERADLRGAGVDGYLDKSLEPNAISDMINQLLRGGITPDRRRHPRVSVHFAAHVETDEKSQEAYARTVGIGGCFLETDDPFTLGTSVTVRFRVPENDAVLEIGGEVVYTRPVQSDGPNAPGMGIKFRDLPPEASESIASYIRDKVRYKVNESTVTFGL